MANTEVEYLYRDASNYKQRRRVVFNGEATPEEIEAIKANLDGDEHFIPSQVGLDTLYGEMGEPSDDDHPWHELVDIGPTHGRAEIETRDIHEFAKEFAATTWDEDAAQVEFDEWAGDDDDLPSDWADHADVFADPQTGAYYRADGAPGFACTECGNGYATQSALDIHACEGPPEPDEFAVGDYVQTQRHEMKGRVTAIHDGCPEGPAWRMMQRPPLTGEAAEGKGTWVSVLVHPNGAVVVPLSDAKAIEPFPFRNPWAEERFGALDRANSLAASSGQGRVAPGVPAGGQFAATKRSAADMKHLDL